MRVIVTGGRDFGERLDASGRERSDWRDETSHLRSVLDDVVRSDPASFVLVQGGARGADRRAREWAQHWGHEVVTFEADWNRHGRAAGPKRNAAMIDAGADLVVAFPGGRGTANAVAMAQAAKLKVRDERGWKPRGQ